MFSTAIARVLFASRWLLTPFYIGLVIALLGLLYKGGRQTYDFIEGITTASEEEVILSALGLIDLTLTGSLLVMVIFSGFANFVQRIDVSEHRNWPIWMVGIDFGELKLKLMASITAIAAIKLLESYMNLEHVSDRNLLFEAGIFGVFVFGALILSISERVSHSGNDDHHDH